MYKYQVLGYSLFEVGTQIRQSAHLETLTLGLLSARYQAPVLLLLQDRNNNVSVATSFLSDKEAPHAVRPRINFTE